MLRISFFVTLFLSPLTSFSTPPLNLLDSAKIKTFVGQYKVLQYRVLKNKVEETDETMRLVGVELEEKDSESAIYNLKLTLPKGDQVIWEMKTEDGTLGDDEIGRDGVRMRLSTFEQGVGWRKVSYSHVGNTQFMVVDTFTFEESAENISFRQHSVRYSYPVGELLKAQSENRKIQSSATEEYIYQLQKR